MADIFISHAKGDLDVAQRVAHGLEQHGWSVWWDPRLAGGESWDAAVERELASANCVVVLWSGNSVKSTWVRNEARQDRDRLIPATIDGTRWPLEFDDLQTVNLAAWNGDPGAPEFQQLVGTVSRMLHRSPVTVLPSLRSHVRQYRRAILFAGATVLAFSVVGVVYTEPWARPRVLSMDSPLPDVVYDHDAATKGQINATAIADILRDLPVDVVKESTDLEWRREADIARMKGAANR